MKNPSNYAKIPDDYQQVEYIQTEGQAYIDTGFCPSFSGTSGVRVNATFSNYSNNSDSSLFGVNNNSEFAFKCKDGKYQAVYNDSESSIIGEHHWIPNPLYKSLPEEYTQVEYIEASGNQIIDTKLYPVQGSTKIELDILPISASANKTHYYIVSAGTNYYISFYRVTSGGNSTYSYNFSLNSSTIGNTISSVYDNSHTLVLNGENLIFTVDGVSFGNFIDSNTPNETICFFSMISSGAITNPFNGRIYSAKISELQNGERVYVRDMVPCLRKLDSKPGLFDIVDESFYPNLGMGEFTYGLPISSQILEYSENPTDYSNKTFTIDFSKDSCRVTNNGIEEKLNLSPENSFSQENSIYIFAENISGHSRNYVGTGIRCHVIKIWNGEELVRHFIPCYWKVTNEPGLYDLVNGQFYKNLNLSFITRTLNEANGWTVDYSGNITKELNEADGFTIGFL